MPDNSMSQLESHILSRDGKMVQPLSKTLLAHSYKEPYTYHGSFPPRNFPKRNESIKRFVHKCS